MIVIYRTILLISAFSFIGCASLLRPDGDPSIAALGERVPESWSGDVASGEVATGWIYDLGSPELTKMVQKAAVENFDLVASAARVRAAGARTTIVGANRLPELSADFRAARSQSLRGVNFARTKADNFSLGLDLAWELDLWGRLANTRRASVARYDAASAEYHSARLSLAANVAKAAISLRENELLIEVANANLKRLRSDLAILDRNLEAGITDDRTPLDISLARADVARAEATVSSRQAAADAVRRRLETLLGEYPAGLLEGLDQLPSITRSVPAGLPSELLLRRPDMIAAERRVAAAIEEVAGEKKNLLPSIRLTSGAGTSTTRDLKDLLDYDSLVWDLAGSLSQRIFEGGRLRAEVDLSKAELNEIAADYASSALDAFREVETAIAADGYLASQVRLLDKAFVAASQAAELASTQYETGLVQIITVLESQRRVTDAESALTGAKADRLRNRIDLHLALGGDFDHAPQEATTTQP